MGKHYQSRKKANLTGVIILFLISAFVLVGPDKSIFSLSTWIYHSFKPSEEVFIIVLLPVYVGIMVFGSGIIGWLLGGKVYNSTHPH